MARPARAGDRLVVVSCHGTVLVAAAERDAWRCGKCGGRGNGNVTVILTPAGAAQLTTSGGG